MEAGLAEFSNDCVGGREGGAADTSLSVEAVFAISAFDGCGVELTLLIANRRRHTVEENSSVAPSARAKNAANDSGNHPNRLSVSPLSRVRQ